MGAAEGGGVVRNATLRAAFVLWFTLGFGSAVLALADERLTLIGAGVLLGATLYVGLR